MSTHVIFPGLITNKNALLRTARFIFVTMENQRHFELYVFGDQTYDLQINELRAIIHDGKSNPVGVEFLERARRALRSDLYQLGPEYRHHAPPFTCVRDLLSWKRGHCVPLDMAVLCIYQLGSFMRYVFGLSHGLKCIGPFFETRNVAG